jgi:hypothetical protein
MAAKLFGSSFVAAPSAISAVPEVATPTSAAFRARA